MLDLLWEKARLKKYRVGKIDCFDHFSFVNVDFEAAEQVIDAFRRGGPKVQLASERPEDDSKSAERPSRGAAGERPERPARPPRDREAGKPERREKAPAGRTMRKEKAPAEGPRMPKTPAAEKKRRLKNWVEKISADIELKEKKSKKKK